jgi:ectoine hydroxylase-related dioxygenase (phytanoyl-CoA dioxygenase family)
MALKLFASEGRDQTFVKDGFVVVDLLEEHDLQALREDYRKLSVPPRPGFDSTILSSDPVLRAAVDAAVRHRIRAQVNRLLIDHRIAFCTFVIKAPGPDGEVPIHQDWSFVDEGSHSSVGLWCPLVDVNHENGCLQVARGSHRFSSRPRAAFTPFAYPDLVPYLRAQGLSAIAMRAGQALLFDPRLMHCSPPNQTSAERVAITAVLVPSDVPLRYYSVNDPRTPSHVEVFEVPDHFYLQHRSGSRPEQEVSLGIIDLENLH